MAVQNFYELGKHYAHEVVVARYMYDDIPLNYAIECMDCNEVLLDFDREETNE
jgi:hypothetical protein